MAATPADAEAAAPPALDDRDRRALEEYLTVLGDVGRARDAPGLYLVVSQSGEQYLVDVRDGVCECADYTYREPPQGCKHVRRVRYATGRQPLPVAVERDDVAVDEQLGEHVAGEVRRLAADGGSGEIVTAGDDGEIIDADSADTEGDAGADDDHDVVGGDSGGEGSDNSADSGDGDTPTLPGTDPGSTPVRGLTATAEIEDGRVSMHARTPDASVCLSTINHTPLSDVEPVATLSVVGDGVTVDVKLQADAAATLADALADAPPEDR